MRPTNENCDCPKCRYRRQEPQKPTTIEGLFGSAWPPTECCRARPKGKGRKRALLAALPRA